MATLTRSLRALPCKPCLPLPPQRGNRARKHKGRGRQRLPVTLLLEALLPACNRCRIIFSRDKGSQTRRPQLAGSLRSSLPSSVVPAVAVVWLRKWLPASPMRRVPRLSPSSPPKQLVSYPRGTCRQLVLRSSLLRREKASSIPSWKARRSARRRGSTTHCPDRWHEMGST